ncbi:hypothetical protein CSC12_0893 [Klebsiella michiganensis]|nr:hypothetical protein CSC12_0893 [Klebsiella michiganensis]
MNICIYQMGNYELIISLKNNLQDKISQKQFNTTMYVKILPII